MIDPLSLGVALAILAAGVMVFVYFFSNKEEGDFEKAFDVNARKLFTDNQKDKPRQKTKMPKKKVTREAKNELILKEEETGLNEESDGAISGDSHEEPVFVSHLAEVAENATTVVHESAEEAASGAQKSKKNKKPRGKRETEGSLTANVASNGSADGKEKSESPLPSTPTPNLEKITEKKKQKKKPIKISELDSNKVLTRLANVDDVEPEYISFLASYFQETGANVTNLQKELSSAVAAREDQQRRLELLTSAKASADKQAFEQQRLLKDLNIQLQQAAQAENSMRAQLSSLSQLHSENGSLKKSLSIVSAEQDASKSEVERLRQEKANVAAKLAALEAELALQRKTNQSLVVELNQTASLKENLVEQSQLLAQLEQFEAAAQLVTSDLERKDLQLKTLVAEHQELLSNFSAAQELWQQKETSLTMNCHSLQTLVEQLKEEVAKFEVYKKEQQEHQDRLIAKENELEEKRQKLSQAEIIVSGEDSAKVAELEVANRELRKTIEELTAQLEESRRNEKAGEEVVQLEKSHTLNSAPSAHGEDTERMRKEITQLQSKVEELRARNFKILENVASPDKEVPKESPSTSNSFGDDRRLLIETIGEITKKPLDIDVNSKDLSKWLREVSSSLNNAQNIPAKKARKGPTEEGGVEVYRQALAKLTSELVRIEKLACAREAEFEKSIAALQSKLEKAQIDSLRDSLTTPTTSFIEGSRSPPQAGVVRSDESDWELVYN